ncbi:alpha/beta hydrolase fold domain-containing protein [Ditylenchus destructor]|uniref:Alpha/beta hydrolase fold domain-containing protein n=1 Tax=Ditylenchus destructor TaxID=166010 RepID=A0AAD4NKM1_9BILA|nr:alpha/beta hydrolase fold domain-containing protein [Ditylenchus destructor]
MGQEFSLWLSGPKIYNKLVENEGPYQANICEYSGDKMLSIATGMRNFCTAVSPILVPYMLHRYHLTAVFVGVKYLAAYLAIAFVLRFVGRATNAEYRKFATLLVTSRDNPKNLGARNELKLYDYECFAAPADFVAKTSHRASRFFVAVTDEPIMQPISEPLDTLRKVLAYITAHTFGRRMLFPGSIALLKSVVNGALVEKRKEYVMYQESQRNILLTEDGNNIDTMFFDRRGKIDKGDTLVIVFEGNAGFYEAGVLVTPLHCAYSVLGFNMPGFGESTGTPYPSEILNSVEAVMQFATQTLGFEQKDIVLYAWSIGGFSASWAAANYNVKAVILDASFDDLVPLAIEKMPAIMSSVVHYTVRRYFNLSIAKQLAKYNGAVLLIRRWNDEIIVSDSTSDEDTRRASNRANDLLVNFLDNRYPGLLQSFEDEDHIRTWLAHDAATRLVTFNVSEPIIPTNISELDQNERLVLIEQLCHKHFLDYEATHNVPLPANYFKFMASAREQLQQLHKAQKRARLPTADDSILEEQLVDEHEEEDSAASDQENRQPVQFQRGTTNQGNICLWYQEFRYVRTRKDGNWFRCERRTCKASLLLEDEENLTGVLGSNEHNHVAAPSRQQAETRRQHMKARAVRIQHSRGRRKRSVIKEEQVINVLDAANFDTDEGLIDAVNLLGLVMQGFVDGLRVPNEDEEENETLEEE